MGTARSTTEGVACVKWSDISNEYFNDDHNYCRNNGSKSAPWCYTKTVKEGKNWDYCACKKNEGSVFEENGEATVLKNGLTGSVKIFRQFDLQLEILPKEFPAIENRENIVRFGPKNSNSDEENLSVFLSSNPQGITIMQKGDSTEVLEKTFPVTLNTWTNLRISQTMDLDGHYILRVHIDGVEKFNGKFSPSLILDGKVSLSSTIDSASRLDVKRFRYVSHDCSIGYVWEEGQCTCKYIL